MPHDEQVFSVCFSPDSRRLVTSCLDGSVRVWDARTGRPVSELLRHESLAFPAMFSPDGQRVASTATDRTARIWDVPRVPVPCPEWLPALAEAVGGRRLTAEKTFRLVRWNEFAELRDQINAAPGDDPFTRVAQWLFADRATRPIGPFASMKVVEFIERRIAENTPVSLRAALRLEPTNGLAWARLAALTVPEGKTASSAAMAEADWCSRRAVELTPDNPEIWRLRGGVLRSLSAQSPPAEAARWQGEADAAFQRAAR